MGRGDGGNRDERVDGGREMGGMMGAERWEG